MEENINENSFIELDDEELEEVSGGKKYVTGYSGDTNVRTGPGRSYRSIGVLHKEEDCTYLGKTARDERGVIWYKVKYGGHTGWVSSKYTKRVNY